MDCGLSPPSRSHSWSAAVFTRPATLRGDSLPAKCFEGGELGKTALLDCYHHCLPDRGGGCSGLHLQRWRRRAFYLHRRFDACRSYLAGGVDLPQSFAAIKLIHHLSLLVPGRGFEPLTNGLQNRCSTAELTRPSQHLKHDPEKWIPVFGKDHAQTLVYCTREQGTNFRW